MTFKKYSVRVFSALMATTLLFTANAVTANAQNSDYEEFSNSYTNVISDNLSNSYTEYLSRFSDDDYTDKDIISPLDGIILENEVIDFEISAEKSGLYNIGMSYLALDDKLSPLTIGLKVDGKYEYANMEKLDFPKMWMDKSEEISADDAGNQFASQQTLYNDFYYNEAVDESVECAEKYMVFLGQGVHKITIIPISGRAELLCFKFSATASASHYVATNDVEKNYSGSPIIIEGESAIAKSSYYLVDRSDNSSTNVSPHSAVNNLINYIGGGNWKNVGDSIVWQTPELKEGYYQIGFSFRQGSNIGGKSYRKLTVDGEVPFAEAERIGFSYDSNWQQTFFSSKDGKPYLVYFPAGRHEIALTVTAAEIAEVRKLLSKAIEMTGDLYIDITKITGETVDIYRDYDLFAQIGDMEERLKTILGHLQASGKMLVDITGEKSGSKYSVIMNMAQTIEQMIANKYEAHRYKDTYYSNYCSVSSVLQELREMPLDIDKISLTAVGADAPFEKSNFFEQFVFSFERFFASFIKDYDTVSAVADENNSITIWVNWGRDQAQVLNSLIKRSFEPETKISVNLKLVNATVIQAILSGNGPDCFLQMPRSEPVNLAMRGVLYDLSSFENYKEVLTRFQKNAEAPYCYNGGLFALPDTQNFYMMFYRKDILQEYGLKVPETWQEFDLNAKLLMRNNMTVWLPISPVTDPSTTGGVGNTSIFPSLLLQNDVSIYEAGGKKTNLLSPQAMEIFGKWTSYYTKLKFPKTLDFYNRFRTGTTPIGIAVYTTYNTIKAAASEIDGKWGIAPVPGTIREDGTVDHTVSGAGTGCVILKSSKNKNGAWKFLDWWTSADTQLSYSNDLEAVLGPTGRIALSNREALKNLSWEDDHISQVMYAWENVEEVQEYPGSYYVSRSIYQAYWNVVNSNKNSKDMLMKFGKEADEEIIRKWKQYANR